MQSASSWTTSERIKYMGWEKDVEKCPDKGKWCDRIHDVCDGEDSDCEAMEIRRMKEAFGKINEVAREMSERSRHPDYPSPLVLRGFAERLVSAIKDFLR